MATLVDIANFALGLCAEGTISSLTDASPQARAVNTHINQTVAEVLREAPWKSARKQAVLSSTTAPAFGWAYAFTLPTDYLRLVYFNDTDLTDLQQEEFEIQQNVLLTDESTVSITYVANPLLLSGDIGKLDVLLVRAIYTALAAKLAWVLQQNRTLKDQLVNDAEMALRKAKAADSRDALYPRENPYAASDWLASRY